MEGNREPPAVTAALVARSRGLSSTRFSPDGRHLAWVETNGGRSDIIVAPADGSGPGVVLTADAATSPFGGFTWAGPDLVRRLIGLDADLVPGPGVRRCPGSGQVEMTSGRGGQPGQIPRTHHRQQ